MFLQFESGYLLIAVGNAGNALTAFFPRLRTAVLIVMIHLALLIAGLVLSQITALDFKAYYDAALCWNLGCNPWESKLAQFKADSYMLPFLYPPTFFIIFNPLLSFVANSAFIFWLIFMELLIVPAYIVLALLVRDAGIALTERNKSIIMAMLFLSGPTIEGLVVGQVQLLLSLAVYIYWYCLIRQRFFAAGVCLAMACLIKPFLVIGIICALWFREWRVVNYFVITILVAILISTGYGIGISAYAEYFESLHEFSKILGHSSRFDLSPSRFFGWLVIESNPRALGFFQAVSFIFAVLHKITIVALIISLFFLGGRSIKSRARACGIFSLLLPLCAPVIWGHYFMWSLFCNILLLVAVSERITEAGCMIMERIGLVFCMLCVMLPLSFFYLFNYPS